MNDIVPKGSVWKTKKGIKHTIVGFCKVPELKNEGIVTLTQYGLNYVFTPEKFTQSFTKDK